MQIRLPCVLMRGGTSRGPFFLAGHLPADPARRDALLLAAMGSPHPLQIDGIGGGNSLTSKTAIVGPSEEPGVDVEYLFAQVSVDRGTVDTRPNCGNMLAAVGPFAIEAGLVRARAPETLVRIRNRNTGALVEAVVQTPDGRVTYAGEAEIPGVPGRSAPVALRFRDVSGSKTGMLFPTGSRREEIGGIAVTLVDGAMPMLLIPASALGVRADAAPEAIEGDAALLRRIEAMRLEAGRRMGLGDVAGSVVPKPALLGPGEGGATLTARYLTPHAVHRAMAVTGGITLAVAARMAGTVAADLATPGEAVRIAHPAGVLEIGLGIEDGVVRWASVLRTARRIFEGNLLVPEPEGEAAFLMAAE
ncbi:MULTISPECIES: 4-oxalomesaconate tautomerase [Roseomonas]|uniref:3-methylitaconate isomerase n=2 Tax=Roseomonas mucosa TaxID=207340 RepID=A0A379MWE3_9PROT|nr:MULTISPECIES: 4-oxalomesaconate tautomerase [Roseomonas]MCG7352818.1 4-oxalomesaconate tautomerase [Roseomonas mucosa]MDT8288541.1 4-oxalomesaconate tautomerase [Roseomonas mucosa]MDT8293618.1 4-oxalomesaconate tautomerase [Roseomonas mucosa]MDT8314214.1 4-oxalomesaconate tautomerase [Roseomonas mucosa]MDT8349719.1 4-oxalomesaconate tautomerase [Roseomonas mucosa]